MTRIYHNDDQQFGSIPLKTMLSTSGLELARKIIAGELPGPSMGKTLNFRMTEADEGRVVFRGAPLMDHYNPAGTVHGGWASAILDSSLACCVWTLVPIGMVYTTAEFKVNLIRPMTAETGEVICEGHVVHMGRKIATSQATLKTLDGKLLAHGTETCAIFDPKQT